MSCENENKLMKFQVNFVGKLSGALGILYGASDIVYNESFDEEQIILKLYKGDTESKNAYEMIRSYKITELLS